MRFSGSEDVSRKINGSVKYFTLHRCFVLHYRLTELGGEGAVTENMGLVVHAPCPCVFVTYPWERPDVKPYRLGIMPLGLALRAPLPIRLRPANALTIGSWVPPRSCTKELRPVIGEMLPIRVERAKTWKNEFVLIPSSQAKAEASSSALLFGVWG
jgi:hypothetical protein